MHKAKKGSQQDKRLIHKFNTRIDTDGEQWIRENTVPYGVDVACALTCLEQGINERRCGLRLPPSHPSSGEALCWSLRQVLVDTRLQ